MNRIPLRTFAGGGKIHKIGKDVTDFDICIVGGLNATALTKFLQNEGAGHKMAIISDQSKFLCSDLYFFCSHAVVKPLKLEAGSVSSQVDASSRIDANTRAVEFIPDENKVKLSNGQTYTYKALVLAPGFDHKVDNIKGLREFDDAGEEKTNVYSHIPDNVARVDRNYYHGYRYSGGDTIVYDCQFPFKNEGMNFYPFYYEYILRQDMLHGRAARNARIQYWTPNKEIFKFSYANEVALDECEKRGIDVYFGWELIEVKYNEAMEKIGVFKNVDTGVVIEKDFAGLV